VGYGGSPFASWLKAYHFIGAKGCSEIKLYVSIAVNSISPFAVIKDFAAGLAITNGGLRTGGRRLPLGRGCTKKFYGLIQP
jgi:hypothetical protein